MFEFGSRHLPGWDAANFGKKQQFPNYSGSPKYTAECDCALLCAVAVKDGKECNIVCDGSPQKAEKGNKKAYGELKAYLL